MQHLIRSSFLLRNDRECKELYEYILEHLKELDVREDIIHEIESLKYKTVLDNKKVRSSKRNRENLAYTEQIISFRGADDEIGQTKVRLLTDTESLLSAIEIIKIYAVTIPSMPYRIQQNLGTDANIQWLTDDNEIEDNPHLQALEQLGFEEVKKNQNMIEDIINEVTANGNDK